jgi:hypothetical protein
MARNQIFNHVPLKQVCFKNLSEESGIFIKLQIVLWLHPAANIGTPDGHKRIALFHKERKAISGDIFCKTNPRRTSVQLLLPNWQCHCTKNAA